MENVYQEAPMGLAEIKRRYHGYLGRLTAAAMQEKVRNGEWSGYAPTGYRNVRDGKMSRVEIDPVLGPLVIEAFRLIAQKHSSLRQVLDVLTPRGLVSRTGKPLGVSALSHLIQNPFYVGMIRYQGALYEGKHQALVSPSLFDRAGRSLRRRRR